MTESELIQATVARWYPLNKFAVCDRVSWGLGLSYEADAIAISDTGLCDELEAKSSLRDLRADLKKHKWKMIETGNRKHFADRFWYVVPEELKDAAVKQAQPRGFGVVVVYPVVDGHRSVNRVLMATRLHPGTRTRRARYIEKRAEVWRLSCFRYWDALKVRLDRDREEGEEPSPPELEDIGAERI